MEDNNTINYISESNRIEVNFSINDYVVSCTITDNKDSLSLQDLLDYLNITEYKGNYQISNKLELESGVQYVANVLHKVISVSGEIDRYIFRKIVDYRNSKMHDMLVQYYCDNEIRQAEECWKNGEYLKAKDLFERNYKNLTKSQKKKMEYIIKNIS